MSTSYALTLAARFFAGVFAGLLWALVAGYAARMVAERLQGRAIAVVMVGIPLALSMGIPAGTFLGAFVGWRVAFGVMSALTLVLIGWVVASVPSQPSPRHEPSATPWRCSASLPSCSLKPWRSTPGHR